MLLRHAAIIAVVLLVAACSGGGCSSGCAGCGMTPLARPIPAASTIPNAGALRVTRSGLDFLAASAPTLAGTLLPGTTGGEFQYPITLSDSPLSGLTLQFCGGGPSTTTSPEHCELDVKLGQANFQIDAVTPNAVTASGSLPVRLEDLPVTASYTVSVLGISKTVSLTLYLGLGSGSCGSSGPPNESYTNIPFTITLPLVADTLPPRVGYTKIDASNVKVNVGVNAGDIVVCADCDFSILGQDINLDSVCDGLTNGIVGLVFPLIQGTLENQIQSIVQADLCSKPDSTTGLCPAGTTLTSGTCYYPPPNSSTCLPFELGLEGHLNLGAALSSISYGAAGQVDLLLAAGGGMIPANAPTAPGGSPADNNPYTGHTPNGMTMGMIGALLPNPSSECVPQAANPAPTGIPIPAEMQQNSESPWPMNDPTGPDLGISLSGRYMNYALGSVYNSGALCLGVTTESFQQLNTGLLSLLAPSMKDLTFEQQPAAAAVITRPQVPPTVAIGGGTDPNTDPLLLVTLKQFAIDFYVFSDDRFVRILTFTSDIGIPLNLSTAVSSTNPDGGLLPVLGNVTAVNGTVTNSELLLEKPSSIAAGLTGLVGTIVSQLTGSLKPISLSSLTSSLGVSLMIPDGGVRKLTSGTDDFVALFADLSLPATPQIKLHPKATLLGKEVHPEAMALDTFDARRLPSLHLTFGTEETAGGPVEYSWWIDTGTRSAWSRESDVTIQGDALFLQGKHLLYVSARNVGSPLSEPETPASVPFTIDVLPPTVNLTARGNGAALSAWDYVSDTSALLARVRTTEPNGTAGFSSPQAGAPGVWSDWQPVASFATIAGGPLVGAIEAEVRDEEGNVSGHSIELIRGQNDAASVAGSCGCSTPGRSTDLGGGSLLLLLGGALGLIRLRRARGAHLPRFPAPLLAFRPARAAAAVALGTVVVAGVASQGCSCGSNGGTTADGGGPDAQQADSTSMMMMGDGGHHIRSDSGMDAGPQVSGCGADCNQACLPSLPLGIIGAYTSMAKASDGSIWVAGYDDSAITQDFTGLYGDLVVGKYDSAKGQVDWTTVDGVPAEPKGTCAANDPTGWRGGWTDPGDDVGLWTSIQLDANDHPIVSYFDATNKALKFASSPDGKTWSTHTVMQAANSDIGRYSKMLVVNGVPVIAFLIMEPGDSGKMRSRVELATGTKATPGAASDWKFEDAAVDDNGPCRAAFCPAPGVCIKETGGCSPPSNACGGDAGGAACASGLVCVGGFDAGPSCGTPLASSYIDIYPNAFGDYITMAPAGATSNGVGIVVYDRIHGALVQLVKLNGVWHETVLDSETGARAPNSGPDGGITPAETGDVGVGASLFISGAGDWHVSYVNGTTEALQYILVPSGTHQPHAPEVVDNGYTLDGSPYADGQHIVGDDSFILVDSHGVVTISYQDATGGTLHVATGTPGSGGFAHTWGVVAASQPNRVAGFFSHSFEGETTIENFWRMTDQGTGDVSGNVSFVTP